MNEDIISCKEDNKENSISDEVFKREVALCKKLFQENGGTCCWGECAQCGVIPFLIKLRHNKILENKDEIAHEKNKIFKNTL